MNPRSSLKLLSLVAGCGARHSGHRLGNTSFPLPPAAHWSISGGNGSVGKSIALAQARSRRPSAVAQCRSSSGIRRSRGAATDVRRTVRIGAGLFSLARWVLTSATLNASLSAHRTRYPVLLYLPGWDGSQGENTVLVQDLASRGFIVAAIGYDDPACAGVDGSASNPPATGIDLSSQAAFEHTFGVAHQKIERVAEAASHVIDALETLDRIDPANRFRGRLELSRIGVVGYSLGGAIAMQLCWRDDRLKAAVNIDGWVFDAAPGGWIEQPLMFISDDTPPPNSTDLSSPDPSGRYTAILG